ncbi:cysteine proteinase inhibitor B-like [Tasmannia lanceolata]|uniref:cysteine proteinase inhibitor B-like n=1 Tax=Tasmannia lanceolata TaxID=3420 RepID=UPI0040634E25
MAVSSSLYIFLLLFVASSTYQLCGGEQIVGGRKEIKDVNSNKEVQDLGKFSVEEFVRTHQGGPTLEFSRVVEAQSQVVSGIKYYLKIEANENGVPKTYDAVVVVKLWLRSNPRQLISFTPRTNKY